MSNFFIRFYVSDQYVNLLFMRIQSTLTCILKACIMFTFPDQNYQNDDMIYLNGYDKIQENTNFSLLL